MRIQLVSVGIRMSDWVCAGYAEYASRLPRECELKLREIAPGKRGKNADIAKVVEDEGQRILQALSPEDHVVALDSGGNEWSTIELSVVLTGWLRTGQHISLLLGGPDGLSHGCRQRANQHWCLSHLTFPHPLVRIIVAEQIYRAWSILQHHPYHR